MSTVTDFHSKAMELAEGAFLARLNGEQHRYAALTRQAFELERQAAELLADADCPEPSRSVLYRSAASLALEVGEFRESERLIAAALSGNPPEEIADELRDLLEQVYFQRHLDLRGVTLASDELQVSIAGNAVGTGIAQSDMFLERLKDFQRVIYRTIERLANTPFREHGGRSKASRNFSVYLSVPRAGSFAVSIKIGQPDQMILPGLEYAPTVIDELIECLSLLNQDDQSALRERIPDAAYFRNFVALAGRLAPDGHDVSLVGLTAYRDGTERRVELTRTQDQMSIPAALAAPVEVLDDEAMATLDDAKTIEVRGELRYADATTPSTGEIKLVDREGKSYTVVVPEGMMSDIVRPLWEDEVVVTGVIRHGNITLQNIKATVD